MLLRPAACATLFTVTAGLAGLAEIEGAERPAALPLLPTAGRSAAGGSRQLLGLSSLTACATGTEEPSTPPLARSAAALVVAEVAASLTLPRGTSTARCGAPREPLAKRRDTGTADGVTRPLPTCSLDVAPNALAANWCTGNSAAEASVPAAMGRRRRGARLRCVGLAGLPTSNSTAWPTRPAGVMRPPRAVWPAGSPQLR